MKYKKGEKVIITLFGDNTEAYISKVQKGKHVVWPYELCRLDNDNYLGVFNEADLEKHPETIFNENFDRHLNE